MVILSCCTNFSQVKGMFLHCHSSLFASRFAAYNGAGSCFDQVTVCVSDAVCNRHLVPVLQACMAEQCDHDQCQKMTRHFYGSMPHNVAEMLVMCQCEASDQSCMHMKTAMHGSTCRDRTWICQDTVAQCAEDSNCR